MKGKINKYSAFSIASLVIWILLFFTSGIIAPSVGIQVGLIVYFLMFLTSLLGIVFGLKSQKGLIKWLLIILNVIAISFVVIPFVLVALGYFPGVS